MQIAIRSAVEKANYDEKVHVILLTGAGKAFCSGYDLKIFAETKGPIAGTQTMPWDPTIDYRFMKFNTDCFMSLWRSYKPVVCKINGPAIAGGSDIALCCDIIIMADDAVIGYPPARVWGCPTTAMWVYRVGAEKAKRLLLTGDLITGREAAQIGLVTASYPLERLDAEVNKLLYRISSVPINQLIMNKMLINQAYENMGLSSTQTLANFFDGIARHSPEGITFKKKRVEEVGFKQAIKERDSGNPIKANL